MERSIDEKVSKVYKQLSNAITISGNIPPAAHQHAFQFLFN